jgi:hypothetical protein
VLVRKGTPAVIAMQYEITDTAAVELSRSFYAALARGLAVDCALTEARKAVALALPGTVEWGTPVLHLRAHDGRIFEVEPDPLGRDVATPALLTSPTSAQPPAQARVRSPRWKKPAIIAASAVAGLIVIGLIVIGLLLPDDKNGDGGSSNAATVDSDTPADAIVLDVQPNALTTYPLDLPPNTVALVTANPGDGLDVDLAAVTDDVTAASIALATYATFTDSFDAYADFASVPPGLVVGRVDEQELGAERLAVLAPDGGSFGIVVGGAAETSGSVTLDIELVEVAGGGAESTYVDRVLSEPRVAETLTAKALDELATQGAIYLPWTDEE